MLPVSMGSQRGIYIATDVDTGVYKGGPRVLARVNVAVIWCGTKVEIATRLC